MSDDLITPELEQRVCAFEEALGELVKDHVQGDPRMFALALAAITDFLAVALIETRGAEVGLQLLSTRVNMVAEKMKKLEEK